MKQVFTAILLAITGISIATAADAPPGEKWKISSKMQMGGMSMPASSTEICKQPGDDAVPVKTEKDCEVYDVSRSGNVQSFKMRCTGKNAMEGSGQFTYIDAGHYKGKMEVTAEGQTITMENEGQKLGACTGGEINLRAKQMVAEGEKQRLAGEKMRADQCHELAAQAAAPSYIKSQCTAPEDRKAFCSAVTTHDKFQPLAEAAQQGGNATELNTAAEICGFKVEAQRAQLCSTAEAQGKLGFLASQCPVEGEVLAKAQCAGRRYTAIADKYRNFCSSYATASANAEANTPAGKAKSIFNVGKKALGGIFNH